MLIITKNRPGHRCEFSWVVCSIVVWEGVARGEADTAYEVIRDRVGKFGRITNRRCEANAPKTCVCQGLDQEMNGASFTFGCSWSMYFKVIQQATKKLTLDCQSVKRNRFTSISYNFKYLLEIFFNVLTCMMIRG